jgi:hypothetical protein
MIEVTAFAHFNSCPNMPHAAEFGWRWLLVLRDIEKHNQLAVHDCDCTSGIDKQLV